MRRFLAESAMSGQVLGVTWFIGNSDDAHADNNIGANPELRRALVDVQEYETVATVPVRGSETPFPPLEADMDAIYRPHKGISEKAERIHRDENGIRINPNSGFAKVAEVSADKFALTTNEWTYHGDHDYVCQRVERPRDNEVRTLYQYDGSPVYYTRRGDDWPDPTEPTDIWKPEGGDQGIDVSHWQGSINWAKVADAGVSFAYIKATEGTTVTDDRFAQNWAGSGVAGILRGAYHYWWPGNPAEQARLFCSMWRDSDLPPAIDLECAVASVDVNDLRRFLSAVEDECGIRPIIYTNGNWWNSARLGGRVHWASEYGLWIADHGVNNGKPRPQGPRLPADWTEWLLWQYTSVGRVSGISGDVDRNVWSA